MNWFEQFEKEIKEISPHFRIVHKKPYAYIYWKSHPFEQVIPNLMREKSYNYRKLYVIGYKEALFSIENKWYSLTTNKASRKELKKID